jgi:hypothetical protein
LLLDGLSLLAGVDWRLRLFTTVSFGVFLGSFFAVCRGVVAGCFICLVFPPVLLCLPSAFLL